MENQQTAVAESSAAQAFEAPSDPKANLEWRKTGELPAATKDGKSKEESTPSKTASAAASEEEAAETAAASATANKQERTKSQSTAADRLNEILADLKKAGLTPAELKAFKREAQAAEPAKGEPPAKTPEKTVNPQELTAPVKPKMTDKNQDGTDKYKSWEEFEEAKDTYHDEMATYRVKVAVQEDRAARAAEAQQQTLAQKVTEAKARYGDQTEATIGTAVRSIISDDAVSPIVKVMLNESAVLVDVMYVLGSKPEELASFVELAKSNPGAAIRKVALLEHLVGQELAKGSTAAAADTGATERGEDGKFVPKPPAKEKTPAPPPPEELSTRRSAPADAIDAAVRNGDFAAFKAEEDRRDLARRKGA